MNFNPFVVKVQTKELSRMRHINDMQSVAKYEVATDIQCRCSKNKMYQSHKQAHWNLSVCLAQSLAQYKYTYSKNSCVVVRQKQLGIVKCISIWTLKCNVLRIEYDATHIMEIRVPLIMQQRYLQNMTVNISKKTDLLACLCTSIQGLVSRSSFFFLK